MAGILLAEPSAADALRRLLPGEVTASGRRPPRARLRLPLRRDDGRHPVALRTRRAARGRHAPHDPPGTRRHRAVRRGPEEWRLDEAWPFLLAGLLGRASRRPSSPSPSATPGASRASVTVGTAPLFSVAIAFVVLDEPLQAGIAAGAALIVARGILLVSERSPSCARSGEWASPSPSARRRLSPRATASSAGSDGGDGRRAGPRGVRHAADRSGGLAGARVPDAGVRGTRRDAVAFLPAGSCFGLSYVLPLRGLLPWAGLGGLADRRDGVAVGRGALRALPPPNRRGSGCVWWRRVPRRHRRRADRGIPLGRVAARSTRGAPRSARARRDARPSVPRSVTKRR